MIVVITHQRDAHGKHMIELLREHGEMVFPLNYALYPQELGIGFSLGSGDGFSFRLPDGTQIEGQAVKSVLNRRRAEPEAPNSIRDQRIRDYIVRESTSFLDALPHLLDCFWLSNPDAVRVASRKPHQLVVAQRIGFVVPPTLITNSPEDVESFVAKLGGDVACKTLWTPGITLEREGEETGIALYTKRLAREELLKNLPRVQNCPMIFQQYVEKAFELRITVVEELAFACAIYSQATETTREDWRNYDIARTPHKQYQLPSGLHAKCIQLVKELGLSFGCIDMIVTPEGEYVFLEINPNGQWLWIEHLTGLPISETMVQALMR